MKKKKNIFYRIIDFLAAVIFILLLVTASAFFFVIYFNSPVQDISGIKIDENDGIRIRNDGSIYIDVRRGETAQSVGLRLERAGLIRSRFFWNLLGRINKEFIKSGTYKLDMPLSQIAIYNMLISGQQSLQRITIPEGVTLKRIARLLESEGICSRDDFLSYAEDESVLKDYNIPNKTIEGYLFPDTYFFPYDYPADKIIRTMADNFFNKLKTISEDVSALTANQLNEKVILASIIEREYRIPEEAALMSGVFYNRMRINMGLQSCATVEYIITEIMEQPHPGFITGADLQINNPYNTYKWAGLPPGPISAPGTVALKAAFFPESSNYYYFRLEDAQTGRHVFTRTNEEHIEAGRLITKPAG